MGPMILGKKGQRHPDMGTFSIFPIFTQGVKQGFIGHRNNRMLLERYGEE